jgi:oxygen-dependent protoporphyrinogen oxidase
LAVTAVSWTSSKWAHLSPGDGDGTVVLRAAVGRDGDQRALDQDDEGLTEQVLSDLTPMLDLRADPNETSVVRWNAAFPQYRPGHLDRVVAIENGLASTAPTVAVAGMYLRGVGIPACIAGAHAAAARLLTHFSEMA